MKLHNGNSLFTPRYSSMPIEESIKHYNSFDEFEKDYEQDLLDENLLLADFLNGLLMQYNVSANKASLGIGVSHSYVGKIINGDKMNPSRDVLLAICVFIGATVEETQTLLKYAGKAPLYVRRKRDVIIWFALMKHQTLSFVDGYLYDRNFPILSGSKD